VNTDETELTHLKRHEKREYENWRSTKKLSTLLGKSEEMTHRKQLAALLENLTFTHLTRELITLN
jgi:hypothetical protein